MKNTKTCPKCKGIEIVRVNGWVGAYGGGNYVQLNATIFSNSIAKVHRYICISCGYTEEWIDVEDLPKIKNSKKAKKL